MPELQFSQDDLIKLAAVFEVEKKFSSDTQSEESYFKLKENIPAEQKQEALHILGILTRIENFQFEGDIHQYYRSADLEAITMTEALADAVKTVSEEHSLTNTFPSINESIVRQAFETDGKILRIKQNASQDDIIA
ncbi:MAG: hypothetical protein IKY98_00910, partial [Alphaproteobacteria bacterium]|nr:hypothetical protein [Alphaproteobacteria bacterium]